MSIFEKYAYFYDLMYKDKNYQAEADYIARLIQIFRPGAKTILDLGCGTGRHAELLSEKGYQVQGVDSSVEMIKQANSNVKNKRTSFSVGDIRNINLYTKFDVVISLFHVMSYQTSNEDLKNAFSTCYNHLCADGIFIFDCWYGPAVLTEGPEVRIKRFENEETEITRIAKPLMNPNENTVDVNYQIFTLDKTSQIMKKFNEKHRLRYLFKPEIEMMLSGSGLKLKRFYSFLSYNAPSQQSWNVLFVASKDK